MGGEADLAGGYSVLFGIYVEGEVTGKTEVEHHLLQEGDGSSLTRVTLELGDCKHV